MEICPCDSQGFLDLERLEGSLRRKQTKLVGVCQASNVTGTIQDLKSVSEISHRYGAKLLVDAAQSAAVIDLDVKKLGIDLLAFTCHKGSLGPQGVGGLYLAEGVELEPRYGAARGAGRIPSSSRKLPDKYESGTLNAIAHALSASLDFVRRRQREIAEAEKQLTGYFLQKARRIGWPAPRWPGRYGLQDLGGVLQTRKGWPPRRCPVNPDRRCISAGPV